LTTTNVPSALRRALSVTHTSLRRNTRWQLPAVRRRLPIERVRWNLTPRRLLFESANTIVVSVPKSGRTWVRVFLAAYRSDEADLLYSGRILEEDEVLFTHDLYAHLTSPALVDLVTGYHLIPRRLRAEKQIVLLARDPRDVFVSLYHQLTKRTRQFDGPMSAMLRHSFLGINTIVDVMNTWLDEWQDAPLFHLVRYEDLHAAPTSAFRELLEALGYDVEPSRLEHALERSSFKQMKDDESKGRYTSMRMRPTIPGDPNSHKVRRGVVGGFREDLHGEDLKVANAALARLSPKFGYNE
jgi:hypothetical protein